MDAMASAPPPSFPAQFAELQTRVSTLQRKLLARAAACEDAAQQLQFERECQAVLVNKIAEIRARKLHQFLRVPENGRAVFVEKSRREARRQHPELSRHELRSLLRKQWELLDDHEQETWDDKFQAAYIPQVPEPHLNASVASKKHAHALVPTASGAPRNASASSASGVKRKRAVASTAAPVSGSRPPSKRRNSLSGTSATGPSPLKSAEPMLKKPKAASSDSASVTVSEGATPSPVKKRTSVPTKKKKKVVAVTSGGRERSSRSSRAKAKVEATASVTERDEAAAAAASPSAATLVPSATSLDERSLPLGSRSVGAKTKPRQPPPPASQRTAATKRSSPATNRRSTSAATTKQLLGATLEKPHERRRDDDNEDDDNDEEDDDDDDDESLSSAGGSASDDDDSDEHMAQLPTGAFG